MRWRVTCDVNIQTGVSLDGLNGYVWNAAEDTGTEDGGK
jgi:hypothetical protein